MSYEAHTEESENGLCTLKIIQDEDAFNPRHEYDHIGHMVCFHRRYDLGDKYHYNDPKLPPPPKKYAKEVMQEEADGYTSCSLQELMESDYKDMTLSKPTRKSGAAVGTARGNSRSRRPRFSPGTWSRLTVWSSRSTCTTTAVSP